MLIFHQKYVQCCAGYKSFQDVNISCELYVNLFQLIQNVNISFEIFANVFGVCANSYKILLFLAV